MWKSVEGSSRGWVGRKGVQVWITTYGGREARVWGARFCLVEVSRQGTEGRKGRKQDILGRQDM